MLTMASDNLEKSGTFPALDNKAVSIEGDSEEIRGQLGKLVEHSHDADEAMKAFLGHEGEIIEIDEATNQRLLRTIDWNLLPLSIIPPQGPYHVYTAN